MISTKLRAVQKGGITLAQSAVNNTVLTGVTAQTITTSFASSPPVGRLLIAVYAPRTAYANILTASGAPSVGWLPVANTDRGTTHTVSIWYKIAGAAEPTAVTFNTSAGAGNIHQFLNLYSFVGAAETLPTDQIASVDGGAGTVTTLPSSLTVSPTLPGELVVAAVNTGASPGGWGQWSGGLSRASQPNPTTTDRLSVGLLVQGAAAAVSTNVTWTTAQTAAGVMASFKAA